MHRNDGAQPAFRILPALVAALLSSAAPAASTEPVAPVATGATGTQAPAVDTASPAAAALDRALAAVDAARIRADVEFLASDELAGRDSPSPGLRIAARFIRARLVRVGWLPGAQDGYFYEYPLDWRAISKEESFVELLEPGVGAEDQDPAARDRFEFASDYFFYPTSSRPSDLSGELVFCGGGSADEFQSVDVAGRWALCLDGDQHWRRRERYAKAAGALGIVVVPGPEYDDEPYAERFAPHVRRSLNPRVSYPREAAAASGPEQAFSQLFFTPEAFARLDSAAGIGGLGTLALGQRFDLTLREQRRLAGDDGQVRLENVAGWWPGSDPELSKEAIVLTAHYDHVGERENGDVYNGADDNGSGTAALMAIAEALAEYGPMRRSVLLLWVSAEEKGLLGSRAWTERPWLPDGARVVCNINMDMVGRNAPDSLLITPTSDHPAYNGLTRLAERFAAVEGFSALGSADAYWQRSDQYNFERHLKVPVAFLFADVHEDYHKPTDTADKLDNDKIRRVTRLVLRMLDGLQADELGV